MKCEICKKEIGKTILNKMIGTVVKDEKGKKHYVCADCQKKFGSKENLLKQL